MEEHYKVKNGKTVLISIDDLGEAINITNEEGSCVGQIILKYIDLSSDERVSDGYYLITNMDVRDKRCGIGTKCLELHKNFFGERICATCPDGNRREDGSYLTGDGVPFVRKMVERGLVEWE